MGCGRRCIQIGTGLDPTDSDMFSFVRTTESPCGGGPEAPGQPCADDPKNRPNDSLETNPMSISNGATRTQQPPRSVQLDADFTGLKKQAGQLAAGEVTSAELVEGVLARIDQTQESLNAFRVVRTAAARDEAADADRRLVAGERLPLLGVPVAVKDDTDVAGETDTVRLSWRLPGQDQRRRAGEAAARRGRRDRRQNQYARNRPVADHGYSDFRRHPQSVESRPHSRRFLWRQRRGDRRRRAGGGSRLRRCRFDPYPRRLERTCRHQAAARTRLHLARPPSRSTESPSTARSPAASKTPSYCSTCSPATTPANCTSLRDRRALQRERRPRSRASAYRAVHPHPVQRFSGQARPGDRAQGRSPSRRALRARSRRDRGGSELRTGRRQLHGPLHSRCARMG